MVEQVADILNLYSPLFIIFFYFGNLRALIKVIEFSNLSIQIDFFGIIGVSPVCHRYLFLLNFLRELLMTLRKDGLLRATTARLVKVLKVFLKVFLPLSHFSF